MVTLASWPAWASPWEWTTDDWAGLTFLVIAIGAFVAWRQVREARKLREEQARPFVVLDFEPSGAQNMINLKITNLGKTIARNVKFQFDPPLTTAKDERAGWTPIADLALFKNGIPSLPPGKVITLFFDDFGVRKGAGLPAQYGVVSSYTDPLGKPYEERTVLDLSIYFGVMHITRHEIHDVHNQLALIVQLLKRWTHPDGLKILTLEDRKRYRAELHRQLEEAGNDSASSS
jgi:hypothetical protein